MPVDFLCCHNRQFAEALLNNCGTADVEPSPADTLIEDDDALQVAPARLASLSRHERKLLPFPKAKVERLKRRRGVILFFFIW